jgi:two-component system, OmpR family, sensor histidine kinase VicK
MISLFPKKAGKGLLGISLKSDGLTVSSRFLKDEKLSSDFILGSIDDGVIMIGKDNVIHLFNKAASKITGWPANEAVGLDFNRVMPLVNQKDEPVAPENNPFMQAMIKAQPVRNNDCMINTRDGRQVAVSIAISPVIEAGGKPPETAVAVFRDITAEKRQEQARSDFISTASHEMRTPIAAIEGYLSLALNEKIAKIDQNARNYLFKARDSTQQLGTLFADLLTSSKAEDGRLSSNPTVVELGEVVEQVTESERFKAKDKRLELKLVVSSGSNASGGKVVRPFYYTLVDPLRMTEVFQNLIDNAIKYTQDGTVMVSLTGDSTTVQVQIQDTGPGIPQEDIPHLFQKFYRVDNSSTRTIGGTGLGLFICKKIVELYKGRVWVESQLGKGSTFFVNLPRLSQAQALEVQKNQASTISPRLST